MDLDDIAVGVVEEDLVPAIDGAFAPVGIGNALLVEMRLEGGKIVTAIGDMALGDRIDDQPGPEAGLDVARRQMHLDVTVGHESDITGIAFRLFQHRQPLRLALESQNILIKAVHGLDIGG